MFGSPMTDNTSSRSLHSCSRYILEDTFTHFLMILTRDLTEENFALIPVNTTETERYNAITIGTATSAPTVGRVAIPNTKAGDYHYIIYGQNSSSNLDPLDAAVVGIVQKGRVRIAPAGTFYEEYSTTLTSDKAYGG